MAQWSLSKIFFKQPTIPSDMILPKSLVQNSLPALKTEALISIESTNKYFITHNKTVKGTTVFTLFNYELIPLKVVDIEISKGFVKVEEIQKYEEVFDKLKKANEIQPTIYKILSNCLTEAKKVKPVAPKPNPPIEKKPEKQEKQKEEKQ